MSIWAIVPAAGRGTRVGSALPKQYLTLAGRSILEHTLSALLSHELISGAMVAIAADDVDFPSSLSSLCGKPVVTCVGGETRAHSVLNALRASSCTHAVVHDAARPLLSADDLSAVIAAGVSSSTGALLASPVADTLKLSSDSSHVVRTVDRSSLWRALTPQVFERDALIAALDSALAAGASVTDEASAMEFVGVSPLLVEGRADNIKVTTPGDLAMAEFILAQRS